MLRPSAALLVIMAAMTTGARSQGPAVDFATDIWPIIEGRCITCHSTPHRLASGAIKRPKGRVILDSPEAIRSSKRGTLLVPGKPDESLLSEVVSLPADHDDRMPPASHGPPLSKLEIARIRRWIAEGARFGAWQGVARSRGTSKGAEASKVRPPITGLAFAPDGATLVAVSQRGIEILRWPSLDVARTIALEMPNVHHVEFSPKGDRVAISGGAPSEAGETALLSWPQCDVTGKLGDHRDSILCGLFRDDAAFLTASFDKRIVLRDLKTGAAIREFNGHSRGVTALCWLPDEKVFVSGSIDQSLRVWNADTGALMRSLNQHTGSIHALALRPGDEGLPMVASSATDRTIRFWQPTIGRMVRYARLPSDALSLAWIDGETIAASCRDGKLRIVDTFTVQVRHELRAIPRFGHALAVHPTDGSVAVGGSDGALRRVLLPIKGR